MSVPPASRGRMLFLRRFDDDDDTAALGRPKAPASPLFYGLYTPDSVD